MKPYEAIIIFNSAVPEEKIDAAVSKFEKKLKDCGATDMSISKWGIKKLASKIKKAKKASEGFYVLVNFNGEEKNPNELRSLLNVSEEVIRYSIVCARGAEEAKEEKVEIEPSMILHPVTPAAGQGENT